jgi:plastocyanin
MQRLGRTLFNALLSVIAVALPVAAAAQSHEGHAMQMDNTGVVMNQNHEQLPRDCEAISQDYQFTVRAGKDYALDEPGLIFGMSDPQLKVAPCSRVEITFVNEDQVRHQWMVHGLPRYLYPAGMFHIEAEGGATRIGTFIVPGENQNYLIHCDMAQHMEMGLRGQLIVGKGSGDLWDVPGVSDKLRRDIYLGENWVWLVFLAGLAGVALVAMFQFWSSSSD